MPATVTPPPAPLPPVVPDVSAWVGATRLGKARDIAYEDRLCGIGGWSLTLQVDDPQRALLTTDTVVKFSEFGTRTSYGIVTAAHPTPVAEGEESSEHVTYSGVMISGELSRAVSYGPTKIEPWTAGGGLDGLRLATNPYTDTRYYNWASPDYDRSAWTSAVELFDVDQIPPQARPAGFDGKPGAWPGRATKWIAPRAISGGAHPPGTWYAATIIDTIGIAAFSYDFFVGCGPQDSAEIWVDGVLVCTIDAEDTNKFKAFNLGLHNAWHVCVVKIVHGGSGASGEITGFTLDSYRHYEDGGGLLMTPINRSSAGYWTCADYPAVTPAWYLDEILADQFTEAQTRGCYSGWTLGVNTTTHTDSNGQKLPQVPELVVRVGGDDFVAVLNNLAEQYIEWDYDYAATNGRQIKIAGIKGDPVPGGGTYTGLGVASGKTFARGIAGLQELSHNITASKANVILTRWSDGFMELPLDPMVGPRKETFLSIPDTKDGTQTFYHTAQQLQALSVTEESADAFSHRLDPAYQYQPGDTVTFPDSTGTPAVHRCRTRAVKAGRDGQGTVTATFGSPRDDLLQRIERWNRRAIAGTIDGRSESATAASQWVYHSASLTPVTLHYSLGGDVVIIGDRATPLRPQETLLLCAASIEADVAGASGATTARIEINGSSIGTVTAPVTTKLGRALLTRTLFTVFDVSNVEITAAGGHSGVTVTIYAMAATWG